MVPGLGGDRCSFSRTEASFPVWPLAGLRRRRWSRGPRSVSSRATD